jgi:Animal haem peroxidase
MGIIDGDHGLPGVHGTKVVPTALNADLAGRSPYTFLFPTLANAPDVGLFPGTSEPETLLRLKQFEEVYRRFDHPTQRMKLSAVYTYFGQFMNHDISAPVGSLITEAASIPLMGVIGAIDPPGLDKQYRAGNIDQILQAIRNEQSFPLQMESLYADGPTSSDAEVRKLYEADGMRFRLAKTTRLDDSALAMTTKRPELVHHMVDAVDIPRDGEKRLALIADRRNDENLIISQLHLALMLLHNKAVAALAPQIADPGTRFKEARKLVTHHYQWCILNDYLPHLLSAGVVEKVLAQAPRLSRSHEVPMEFTTAAFRFGHSMVSQEYDFNDNFGEDGHMGDSAELHELFAFTSRGGMAPFGDVTSQLPDHWVADWDRLTHTTSRLSGADRIDMSFASDMLNHMAHAENMNHASIFFRNIVRGFHRRIPFGQDLAKAYGLTPLAATKVLSVMPEDTRSIAKQLGFDTHTPAWLYFLCEAQAMEAGQRVGPTASHIIADTIIGLLRRNAGSVLNTGGNWHPRDSLLKMAGAKPLQSIAAMLLYAVEGSKNATAA